MLWWKSINIFYFEHVQVNVQNKFLEVKLLDQVYFFNIIDMAKIFSKYMDMSVPFTFTNRVYELDL